MQESHIRFCEKYFETLNASASAEYAGFSTDTARQQGWQLLQREDVQQYLQELREAEALKHGITKDRWLSELATIGFSNVQDFISHGNNIKDITTVPEQKARAVLAIKKTVTEFEGGEKVVTEFKLHDKLSALDKIGRHFDFYNADSSSKPQNTTIVNLGTGVNPDEATQ